MSTFPYAGLPRHQIWKRAVTDLKAAEVDPQLPGRFQFDRAARVASAGSCFASRIADALRGARFTYFVTESGPAEQHFGRYSARYGEIYTALQLNQLVKRAFGTRGVAEPPWVSGKRYYDPLRPRAVPGGFPSVEELEADRERHMRAVERLVRESDVFIFTLGLTETWCSRADGTALPLCPGAGIGTFDASRYEFRNLDVTENITQLEEFLELAWSVNPKLRVILTLSPVPLAATIETQHVIAATVYSKSVLRVAAETLRRRHANLDYFASYEIVTGGFCGSDAFGPDRREVSDAAVSRVMRSFFTAFTSERGAVAKLPQLDISLTGGPGNTPAAQTSSDLCNEAYLASFIARSSES